MHTKVHWIIELPDFLTRLDFVMNIHPKAQYDFDLNLIFSALFWYLENFNLCFPALFYTWRISISTFHFGKKLDSGLKSVRLVIYLVAQNHFVEGCENFVLRFSADFLECVFLICSKTTSIFLDYLWLKVSPESLKSYSKHRINKVFLIRLWISHCLKITLKFPDFRGKNWTQKYAQIFFHS